MTRLILLLILAVTSTGSYSQCNGFYEIENGSEWEMESYNAKGKPAGKIHQKVTAYDQQAGGYKATIHSVFTDEKGKEVTSGDLEMSCNGGTVQVDMRNYINEEQLKPLEAYKLTIETENLEMPNSLSVGQTLKDGSITLTATESPMPMHLKVNITDRKVVGKETITTPAGTFECYKITSNITSVTKMAIGITVEMNSVEWIAPKVAVVKSENYRKGKLQGYTLLTSRK